MESSTTPKISVIIPLYNKAPYIKRALNSVITQTIQDFEVIVVNDGSRDGGEKIVEKYGDSRIHLINQENQGVSAARNQGIGAARAELVAFLDADDEWLPEFLETILRMREMWPNAGIYATSIYVTYKDSIEKEVKICNDIGSDSDTLIYDYFKHSQMGKSVVNSSTVTIPKKILYKVGLFNRDATEFEDLDVWCRIAYYYDIACSKNPQVIIHKECSNINSRMIKNKVPTQIPFEAFLEKVPRDELENHKHYDSIMNYIASLRFSLAHRCVIYNEREKIRTILKPVTGVNYLPRKMLYLSISLMPNSLFLSVYSIIRKVYHFVQHCKNLNHL